jgi:DNA-directed RNA polymerase specialized sigma24 family protein
VKRASSWFLPLYDGLCPVIVGLARKYGSTWGVEADDLVQVAGLALWESCERYSRLPLDQQLRIGNTVVRRTMLHWCEHESHTPTHLGTAGSTPWFTVETSACLPAASEEEQ